MIIIDTWLMLGVTGAMIVVSLFAYLSREESFQLGLSSECEEDECVWKHKRFLVLCNPVGGKRQGELIVKAVVQPLCAANSISLDVLYTERPNHAFEIALNTDFRGYAGILLVSGDGLIHEFLNGLAARVRKTHSEKAREKEGGKEGEEEEEEFVSFLASFPPLGVLPGGTCNGVCATLHSPQPVAAMQAILRGKATPVDLYHVLSPGMLAGAGAGAGACAGDASRKEKGAVINAWDVHYFSWAMIADADDIIERKVTLQQAQCNTSCDSVPCHVISRHISYMCSHYVY